MTGSDSAGVPWEGRRFEPNPAAGDDGGADPRLADAVRRFRGGSGSRAEVIDGLRGARLLVPLVAEAGDEGVGVLGQRVDKTQELAIVTVAGPDGRTVLPAFSSVAALAEWRADARPIPVDARRVALAAAGEGTDAVVLDPGSAGVFALRRSAIRALALDVPWRAAAEDPEVAAAVDRVTDADGDVLAARSLDGDPEARLTGPELVVAVVLRDGVDRTAALHRLSCALSADPFLADRVDSLTLSVVQG